MPRPRAFHDGNDVLETRSPTEFGANFFRRRDEARGIAGTAGFFHGLDVAPRNCFAGFNDLANRSSSASAQIVKITFFGLHREDVGLGKVENMNVVADAGAVRRGVIGAENIHRLALAEGDFKDVRDEVRFDAVVFAELFGGSRRVKIALGDKGELMNLAIPAEDRFEHEFGLAVGIDRTLRQRLVDRHALGDSKGRAG